MRKFIALAILLAFCVTLGVTGTVMAQKKHASKGVWRGMIANLTDVQGVTAALMVFDMERATFFAEALAKRERYVSTIEQIPEPVRKRYAKLADIAEELAAATRSGDEQAIAMKIGAVMAACSSCHYDVRDAERRKKLE
jgi:cytochrome c556